VTEYVTLVPQGGQPVRLGNQTGAPWPTTGSGSLVFSDGAILTDVVFDGVSYTGSTTLSTLTVTGITTLSNTVSMGASLSVAGTAILSSTLSVGGAFTSTGAATLSSTLAVAGTATLAGDLLVGGTLTVTGASSLAAVTATTVTATTVTATTLIGAIVGPFTSKTANYTITSADNTVLCLTNAFTLTLPTAIGLTGRKFYVKNGNTIASGNNISIATTSAQTIDGSSSAAVTPLSAQTFQSDGANWWLL